MAESDKPKGGLYTLLDRIKEKAIKEGRWIGPDSKDSVPGKPEGKKALKILEAEEKRDEEKKRAHDHRKFKELHPEIFTTFGRFAVFDYCWRYAHKTRTGKLRWCGYIKFVADELGRSYSQTRRDFIALQDAGVFHRWNTGKRFPANIASGLDPQFHQTVITIAWNAADLKRQKILAIKEVKKRERKARACLNT